MKTSWTCALVAALAFLAAARPAAPERLADAVAARAYFTDVELTDQHGATHRLYSDLMADKVVIISAFFTACQGVCPVMAGRLKQVQDHLGDRMGKEVVMLTLTLDPEADTPAALARYAEQLDAGPGWYFLTGPRPQLEAALKKLGQYVENKEAHSSVLVLGNEPTGLWKKVFAMASIEELRTAVDSVVDDDGTGTGP